MKNKKIVFCLLSSVLLVGTTIFIGSNTVGNYAKANAVDPVWNHYERLAPTSTHNGCKEYWVNCTTHETKFKHPGGTPVEKGVVTEAFADALGEDDLRVIEKRPEAHAHTYESSSNVCTVCGATNLLKFNSASFIGDPSKLTETTDTAPAGFEKVYSYTGACGESINSNTFFKSDLSAGVYTHISFAILQTADNPIKLYAMSGSYLRHSLKTVTEDTWVTIDAKKDATGTWTVSNDLGLFTAHTGTEGHTYTAIGPNLYMFMLPTASNPIKFTEILADCSTTKRHIHEFDASGTCTKCGYKSFDYLGTNSKLRDKTKISKTNMNAPAGFEDFYYYSEAVSNGGSSTFFIDGNATGLASATEFRFAVIQRSGNEVMIQQPQGSYYNYRFLTNAYNLWGYSEKSSIVYVYGNKTGDNEWTITNSVSKFRQNGSTSNDITSFTINPAYGGNYWNYVLRLSWSNAYITEILYK